MNYARRRLSLRISYAQGIGNYLWNRQVSDIHYFDENINILPNKTIQVNSQKRNRSQDLKVKEKVLF